MAEWSRSMLSVTTPTKIHAPPCSVRAASHLPAFALPPPAGHRSARGCRGSATRLGCCENDGMAQRLPRSMVLKLLPAEITLNTALQCEREGEIEETGWRSWSLKWGYHSLRFSCACLLEPQAAPLWIHPAGLLIEDV